MSLPKCVFLIKYLTNKAFLNSCQTADSVVVKNPPPDASEPNEWKEFFDTKFGPDVHVTCCTIARDNYLLVRALVLRREILQKLKWKLPPGTQLDIASLAVIANDMKEKRNVLNRIKSLATPDVPELFKQLIRINTEVRKLASVDFPVTRVFVTFETEKAQRHILHELSVGSKAIRKCDKLKFDNPDHLYRSIKALHVKEAPEPSTIRWHDLSDHHWERSIRYLLTTYAWACAMIFVVFIVRLCHRRSAKFAAYAIASCNGVGVNASLILHSVHTHLKCLVSSIHLIGIPGICKVACQL